MNLQEEQPTPLASTENWIIIFPAEGDQPDQKLNAEPWATLGQTIACEFVRAFKVLHADNRANSRRTRFTQANKLRNFLEQEKERPDSLTKVTGEMLDRFKTFIETVESTRRTDYAIAKDIIVQVCKEAGCNPPPFDKHPFGTVKRFQPNQVSIEVSKPETEDHSALETASGRQSKSRNHIAKLSVTNVVSIEALPSVKDGPTVVFPARGKEVPSQTIDFSIWNRINPQIALQVAKAFSVSERDAAFKARITKKAYAKKFFVFLSETLPAPDKLGFTLEAVSSKLLANYQEELGKLSTPASRQKHWLYATHLVEDACTEAKRAVPQFNSNPWPGASARMGLQAEILTVEEIGAILRASIKDMEEVLTQAEVQSYEGPALPDLMGFLVPMAFWTNFNPDTVVALRCSDRRPDVLGRIVIVGEKKRSARDQVASFAAHDTHICSPIQIFENLKRITAGLRARLPIEEQDYLFIGRMRDEWSAKTDIKPFKKCDGSMQHYYRKRFCERHSLPLFNLQEIRATGGTIVNKLFGNDQKTAQILMNHLSIDTTDGYVRREALRDEQAQLADQMEKRARFVRSGGARDIRDASGATQSAATPGFVCADPWSPPENLGQKPGMCAAYGACPTCPLASIDRLCPTSLAYILRLRNDIRDAKEDPDMDPHRWLQVWRPRMHALNDFWLPLFEASVHEETKMIKDVRLWPIKLTEI